MAAVTRYFGTADAGLGDGTSYANRAALFDGSGNWSSILTGHDFSSNSLNCMIDSGTYTSSQDLTPSIFTVAAPQSRQRARLLAAPGGSLWNPPDPYWTSAQPIWDVSDMPKIEMGDTILTGTDYFTYYGMHFEKNGTSANHLAYFDQLNTNTYWCFFHNATDDSSAQVMYRLNYESHNCVYRLSGNSAFSIWNSINKTQRGYNCRLEANPASNAIGMRLTGGGNFGLRNITIVGVGDGILSTDTSGSFYPHVLGSIIVGNGSVGDGFQLDTSNSSYDGQVLNSVIANFGGTGVLMDAQRLLIGNTVFASNDTNRTLDGEDLLINNFDSSDDLADIFVDPENADYTQRDFRIKNTSAYWGKNIGVADEPASGGGTPRHPLELSLED